MMRDFWSDVKHALHMFQKSPGFTIAAVAALALGIGANTAIFTVVNAVLLKPLSYPDADRIMAIVQTYPEGNASATSITKFHEYQRQSSVLQDVAAYDFGGPGFNITGGRPEQVHGIHVTEAYFRLFGAGNSGADVYPAGGLAERRQRGGAELRAVAAQVRWQPQHHRAGSFAGQ
jgi:putative ABC transport system permease protein